MVRNRWRHQNGRSTGSHYPACRELLAILDTESENFLKVFLQSLSRIMESYAINDPT